MFIGLLVPLLIGSAFATPAPHVWNDAPVAKRANHHKVIILGGGVTGIIAARTLHRAGVDDFLIVEARSELGGRLKHHDIAGLTVELGANWVEGTQSGTFVAVIRPTKAVSTSR